jgi:transglutaminase-like putative cysteine protease
MFRPRESHDLRLMQSNLEITPSPSRLRWRHNVCVTLEHFENTRPEYPPEEYAKTYPFRYSDEEPTKLARALVNQHSSESLSRWASQFVNASGATGTMDLLRAMSLRIRQDFRYARRTEKGVESPEETLRRRSGSCRDFAAPMIEATRSLGLAARFVSGYIFAPGMDAGVAKGAGSTHAWMQACLPGEGWVDFDPANSIAGNRNLIRVAMAWDHRQVLPLWGTYSGDPPSSFLGMDAAVSAPQEAQ